ncbi:hypothetical protein [Allorhodopirellula heiligendammensis]|uniref:Uncharacterized protein n=1 Tax=Allorhodopirellula heiligendammensis TaxID=2714739 RepID=A0A5C6B0G8_9BACT|nr:hypothetical protein [Allorhodopirellula heiligendammensis]TWU05398.1 hypothetical protein Poly21_56950 [Allorhodopirellula heiligendammensis]
MLTSKDFDLLTRSGGGAVSGEFNVYSRRPLIPNVLPSKHARNRICILD